MTSPLRLLSTVCIWCRMCYVSSSGSSAAETCMHSTDADAAAAAQDAATALRLTCCTLTAAVDATLAHFDIHGGMRHVSYQHLLLGRRLMRQQLVEARSRACSSRMRRAILAFVTASAAAAADRQPAPSRRSGNFDAAAIEAMDHATSFLFPVSLDRLSDCECSGTCLSGPH